MRGLLLLVLCVTLTAGVEATCGERCPFGNNDCADSKCTRCFPLWSGVCLEAAVCGEDCSSDTDCDQTTSSQCQHCRAGRCSVARCNDSPCSGDQDCMVGEGQCSYCDPKGAVCVPALTCMPSWSSDFSGADSCTNNKDWYFSRYCAVGCSPMFGPGLCQPNPNATQGGVMLGVAPCTGDCVCRGRETSGCYNHQSNLRGAEVVTRHALCYGSVEVTFGGAHTESNGQNVPVAGSITYMGLARKSPLRENSFVEPGGLSMSVTYIGERKTWAATVSVTGPDGVECFAANENFSDLSGLHVAGITWSAGAIVWSMDGVKISSFYPTSSCIVPKPPLWAAVRTSVLEEFKDDPVSFKTPITSFKYTRGA